MEEAESVNERKLIAPALIIAGVVVVVLLIVCGCIGGGSGNDFNTICGGGGTYWNKVLADKEKEFELYIKINEKASPALSISEAVKLDARKLFEDSIKSNLAFPYGTMFQKYNYVVCGEKGQETIWVAKWNVNTVPGISQCLGPRFEIGGRSGMMINVFPEHEDARMGLRGQQSPCWLDDLTVPDENLETEELGGLLDAISKHYMIAQGPRGTPGAMITIAMFDADEWSKTRVRYAGEIIVDVEKCEYGLNNDSGTYRPQGRDKGQDELLEMADLFSKKLGVSPTFVIDVKYIDDVKRERGGTQISTGQLVCN